MHQGLQSSRSTGHGKSSRSLGRQSSRHSLGSKVKSTIRSRSSHVYGCRAAVQNTGDFGPPQQPFRQPVVHRGLAAVNKGLPRKPAKGTGATVSAHSSDGRGRKSNTRPVTAKYQAGTSSSRMKKVPSIPNFAETHDSRDRNSFRNAVAAQRRREMTQAVANEDLRDVNNSSKAKQRTAPASESLRHALSKEIDGCLAALKDGKRVKPGRAASKPSTSKDRKRSVSGRSRFVKRGKGGQATASQREPV
jgi:hypothetical protein